MDGELVAFAERRALSLDLTYSRYLSPYRLLAQVLNMEHRAISGLPDPNRPAPCFGRNFSGQQDPDCAKCQVQAACLLRTASKALPEVEAAHPFDTVAIAAALDSSLHAVGLMQAMRFALSDMHDEAPLYLDRPVLLHGSGRKPVVDLAPYRRNLRYRQHLGADACRLSAQGAETGWPAHPAEAPQRLGTKLRDVFVICGPVHLPPKRTYGNPVFRARVRRTQARLPELAWCPDGTVLRRVYKNEVVEVTLYRDRFEYKGQPFASLAEVVAVVDGKAEYRLPPSKGQTGTRKMTKLSAPKFFADALVALYLRALHVMHDRCVHQDKAHILRRYAPQACLICGHDFVAELKQQAPNIRWPKNKHFAGHRAPPQDATFYWSTGAPP